MGTSELLMSPIIQYGFAGMCGVLIAIIVWLISKLLGMLEKTNKIIAANTSAIINVDKRTEEELVLVRAINDKLLARPCIAKGEN